MGRRAGDGTFQRVHRHLMDAAFASPLYRLTLMGRPPEDLVCTPMDPWPGDADKGAALVAGRYSLAGRSEWADAPPWRDKAAGPAFLEALHGFDWLRDLRAMGGDGSRRHARHLVGDWLDRCRGWDELAWRPDVLGTRISSWLGTYDFFIASADDAFRRRVFASLAEQVRHLARALPSAPGGVGAFTAVKGMVQGALALDEEPARAKTALDRLAGDLSRQILPDGCHVDRNPATTLTVLRHLIDLRTSLMIGHGLYPQALTVPEVLQNAIDRMAPALRFFRHGDGALAVFNGSCEGGSALIDSALTLADAKGRPLKTARQSGYERVLAGRTLLLMDVGGPPPPGFDGLAHAGPLSFELSTGRQRMIVNCGATANGDDPEAAAWRLAMRATAAHSTLVLADTNAYGLHPDGGIAPTPMTVTATRHSVDGGVLIDASHDAYRPGLGLVHRRRLFLSAAGDELRGEDSLLGMDRGVGFAIRFHLHPQVRTSLLRGGDALIRMPGGAGWRLQAAGGNLGLEDSIYLGAGDRRGSRQLVVTGETGGEGALVNWVIAREGR